MRQSSVAMFRVYISLSLAGSAMLASTAQSAAVPPTPSFMGLGTTSTCRLPSAAFGVSADGSVVVGRCQNNTGNGLFEAFRWTQASGIVTLGDLPGDGYSSQAIGVSANGSVVVGSGRSTLSDGNDEALRWTQATGLMGLGVLPGGVYSSSASDVSADGSVIVGFSSSSLNDQAFRWTQATGMVGLGAANSLATGVSANGDVIVGYFGSQRRPFRWTSQTGLVNLGLPADGSTQGFAEDIAADGSIIVGYGRKSNGNNVAFAWQSPVGYQTLPFLPNDTQSAAFGVSGAGGRIVGYSRGGGVFRAALWDGSNGVRDLKQMLEQDFGLNLAGWSLTSARAISDDGTTIVGVGTNPRGDDEAFRAVIPEPASALVILLCSLFVASRPRRHRRRRRVAGVRTASGCR